MNLCISTYQHTKRIHVTWRLLSLCSICVIIVSHIHRHTSKLIEQCVANGTVIQLPLPFTLTLTRTIAICNYGTRYAVKLRQRSTKLLTHGIFLHSQSLALSISDHFSEKNLFRWFHYEWIIKSSSDICYGIVSVVSAYLNGFRFFFFLFT